MKALKPFRLPMIIGFIGGVVLALVFYFLLLTFLGPYLGLPTTAPKNATQTVVVLTQSGEISRVSGQILIIEGILLGLSPLYFDKLGRAKLGASAISVTAIALFLSLITILFADTNANPNIVAWVYFGDISGLLILTVFFAGSAWYVALGSKDRAQKDKATKSEKGEPLRKLDKAIDDKETSEPTPPVKETTKSEETNPDTEREKLRYYWDYERSYFTQILVLLFSALVATVTILNAQVASPIIKLNVYYEDAVILMVFAFVAYRLGRVIIGFKRVV